MRHLFFVHEDKASYPELSAYGDHLKRVFTIRHATQQVVAGSAHPDRSVLWYIMGFYRKRVDARFVIHDYRSLSSGRFGRIKDRLKRRLNHRPDLRIFLNAQVRRELDFRDDVPWLEIDMGVPPGISARFPSRASTDFDYDFCYIGQLTPQRHCDRMLDSFLARFGDSKRFVLVGRADEKLRRRYGERPNLEWAGRVVQDEAFDYVARSNVAVCYIPTGRPHCFQTPTKLLEYAALGKPIVANASACVRQTARRYGIRVHVGRGDMFGDLQDLSRIPDNRHLDASRFEWPSLLERSGIRDRLLATVEPVD